MNLESDDLDISDDPFDTLPLDVSRVPLILTLTRISGKYIIDATAEEEAAAVSSVIVAIDGEGQLVHSKKCGIGTLYAEPLKEALPVSV